MNVIDAPAQDWAVYNKFLLLILIAFTQCICSLNPALSARYFKSVCSSRRVCSSTNHNLAATLRIASSSHTAPDTSTPSRESPSFLRFLQESENCVRKLVVASNGTILTNCLQKCRKQTLKHFQTVGWSADRSNYIGEILLSFTYTKLDPPYPMTKART
jgi:hypothetical protein